MGEASDQARLGRPVSGWTPPPRPAFRVLEGRLVRLEPLRPDHATGLHAANGGDLAIWDYLPYGPFATDADYAAWVGSVADRPDPMFFAVIDGASGQPRGVASYLRIDPPNGVIEVGHIALSPPLQKTVAATEALVLMMRNAFALGYRRYEWKCNAANLPSRRAGERLGLSFEGVFRQAAVVKGRNRDTAWFAATDGDWTKIAAAFDAWLDPGNFDAHGRQRRSLSDLTRPVLVTRDPALA